jgi:3',5'-cyclic AMP phosphodiesterase CpdA
MKTIAHISDLHFGTEDVIVADALLKDIQSLKPSVAVISGDLTQRARTKQFEFASAYLKKIPFPRIVVPGNHDIPLFDIFRRIFSPLRRYKKIITDEMLPVYEDDEMLIAGINTSRNYLWRAGSISDEQIGCLRDIFCKRSLSVFKVLVAHHPFIPPPDDPGKKLVSNASKALEALEECGLDLMLAGHLHQGYSGTLEAYYPKPERTMVAAQAGTAISKRRRGELNSYNLITVHEKSFSIEVRNFESGKFAARDSTSFIYEDSRRIWKAA